jgi:hypothetical protein
MRAEVVADDGYAHLGRVQRAEVAAEGEQGRAFLVAQGVVAIAWAYSLSET